MTGSHPRHAYLARAIAKSGLLAALVEERREEAIPDPPAEIAESTKNLFIRHFGGRSKSESAFFGEVSFPDVPALKIEREKLNDYRTIDFINSFEPDIIISYGVHKLESRFLDSVKSKYKWNIHGGLSPWYRGVITHFWPSYFLEPQMTGMTLHELTDDIDGGNIVHQSAADLVRGDGIHELACRAVISMGDVMPRIMEVAASGQLLPFKPQKTSGRIWRSLDWRPEHLHLIYEYYDNRVVDHYLDGKFKNKEPRLVRQF